MSIRLEWDGKSSAFYKPKNIPLQPIEVIKSNKLKIKEDISATEWRNKLLWGDNKAAICSLLDNGYKEKIDLIYIDPPFLTGNNFGFTVDISGKELEKEQSSIKGFAYKDIDEKSIDDYLQYMYERLILMKDLLSKKGSIYVHLDWRLSSFIKIILDDVFGKDNFINEIVWNYSWGIRTNRRWNRKHDIILMYSKNSNIIFNFEEVLEERKMSEPTINRLKYKGALIKDGNKGRGQFELALPSDVWYVATINGMAKERLNYPTQKPEELIERIIKASSNEDSIVADFFCGSGTTGAVAENLGRKWVICDSGKYAVHTTKKRIMNIENHNPFEIINLCQYEKHIWYGFTDEQRYEKYINFVLKAYKAKNIDGYKYINGKKGNAFITVGEIDNYTNIAFIEKVIKECKENNINTIDILAWEYTLGIENEIPDLLRAYNMESLKIKRKIIPNEIFDNSQKQRLIKFYEPCYAELETKVKEKTISIKIKDFTFPLVNLSKKSKKTIKENKKLTNFDFIDYWSIDWNYDGKMFNNQWQEYRTKKEKTLKTMANNTYKEDGKYNIFVKVIDILGNDTSQILKIKIGN